MFDKIIKFLKGVMKRMLDNVSIKKAFNIDSIVSKDMYKEIELWKSIYKGEAPWKSEYVECSKTPAQIAGEFARLTTLEFESEITGSKRADFLNEIYMKFKSDLVNKIELANAVGGMYFKPYVSNNKIYINCIEQGKFIPVSFDGDGLLTSVVFIDTFTEGNTYYTRLEWHNVSNNELKIINKAFKSDNSNDIGSEIMLSQVNRWSTIEEETTIKNVSKLLGGFYKVPKANSIDKNSPLGISVFARAIEELEKLDKQKSRLDWEYESGERKLYVDILALSDMNTDGKSKKINVNKRLFKSLNVNKEDFFEDYSPEIRDEAYIRGLNKYKQEVEFACDLAYGTISDPALIEKTATEIKTSKQKSYAVVSQMQRSLENALNDLIEAIDILCTLYRLAPNGKYEVSYKWDDSIIVDAEAERRQDIQDINLGIMTKAEYRMKWYGEDEATAEKKLPEQADVIE